MEYTYLDKTYNIKIIRKNNKNTYIRFRNNEIIVSTNYLVSNKRIEKLINDNKSFIEKAIDNSNNNPEEEFFKLFGKIYDIVYINTIKEVNIEDNKIYAKDNKSLNKYLNKHIYEVYNNRLNYWYNVFEEKIPTYRLVIRKMKSRWGVCNIKSKTITLNLELSKYDLKYLDYVIIHELSHLIYFNHSKEFWNIVGKYCNNYKEIRKDMKKFIM